MPDYQYSQIQLDELADCAKRISDPPKKEMKDEAAFRRNDFRLESIDGSHQFQAFFRQNQIFLENVSLGLDYLPKTGGRFPILRLNGPHGDSNRSFSPGHPHCDTHIHRMAAEDLVNGILKPRSATVSREYATFEQAVPCFLKLVNVVEGIDEHFGRYIQMVLPFLPETRNETS